MEEIDKAPVASAKDEIADVERFGFGANWRSFLENLDDEGIEEARRSIRRMLEI